MKVLITGKDGQLGMSLQKLAFKESEHTNHKNKSKFVFIGREDLDLDSKANIEKYFKKNKFDIIINCAAYTAVDKAESEIKKAYQVNDLAVKQLAQTCKQKSMKFIHISTDYVFDGTGTKPHMESGVTNPINIYGKSKLSGERGVLKIMKKNALIIRTSWVYSEFGNNFVKNIIKLGHQRNELNIVNDQIGSPTYAADLASAITQIISNKKFKFFDFNSRIYNYSNAGNASWYQFAYEIFNVMKIDCKVNPINSESYPTPAKRPKYTVLNASLGSNEFGLEIHHWKKSLARCLKLL
ncbi:dTDP-4-dehydrorhamnose reductase [Gammaproteobacteria bacterium]|nr:dTDP-4-dehydrorhamnose reductase [Gammaproteobacteria bacterium]